LIKSADYSPSLFAKVVNEVLGAVAYLHSKSIAHLDLKMENVLLKGPNFSVKVADFGLSKKPSPVSGEQCDEVVKG